MGLMRSVFTWLVLHRCLVDYVAAQTSILPCGILYNRDELSLLQSGFIKCYDQPYSHVTISTELAACTGTNVVFVGAKLNSSTTIALGAFGLSSNVYKKTSSTTTANSDPGGAYWYNYPLYGFGFSGVSTVNIYDCDNGQPAGDCEYRLCWNLDYSIGGYRAGCTESLNGDSRWRKVMYKGNQVYSCTSVCSNGAVRLQNGTTAANGRVEVCYNNAWRTVCDSMWGNQDAQVVCRQLGYAAGTALSNAYYGQGNVPVLLENVNCLGTEANLLDCPNSGIGMTSCTHADDASVQCRGCGVLYNYDEATLYLSGYTKCYDQPYSHITTSAELAACNGSTWVFVGAKNSSNSSAIVLGAFGYSSAVYTKTISTTTAYLDRYGGAYWYNYPLFGFGFSGVSTVRINDCDYGQPAGDCAYRLCWNLDYGLAGYRIGCVESLNSDSNRRKVMYKGEQVNVCTPDINECTVQNGNCSQLCNNIAGSYFCSCINGFMTDGRNCTDINECVLYNGNCSQICSNTLGSYKCACNKGYLMAPDNATCYDNNECSSYNGNCSQTCTNTNGSYYCSCSFGYTLSVDNTTCLKSTELIQLRLTEVQSCNDWKSDNVKTQLLVHAIENGVDALCLCGFTIYNSSIFCFDNVSIILRGQSEIAVITYFQHWVSSENPILNIQGTILRVDKNCKLIIQSLDDATCQSTITTGEQQSQTTQVGVIVGVIVAVITAFGFVLILLLILWSCRRMKKGTFVNPIYSTGNVIPDHYDLDTTPHPAYSTISDPFSSCKNPPANPSSSYSTVAHSVTNERNTDVDALYETTDGNSSITNYGNSSGDYKTCIYDTIGNPVLHDATPSKLSNIEEDVALNEISAKA